MKRKQQKIHFLRILYLMIYSIFYMIRLSLMLKKLLAYKSAYFRVIDKIVLYFFKIHIDINSTISQRPGTGMQSPFRITIFHIE